MANGQTIGGSNEPDRFFEPQKHMNPKTSFDSPGALEDPRCRPDFLPQYYPKLNGGDGPPPGSTTRNDLIMIEFRAAYYDLNYHYSRLLEVRGQGETPGAKEREFECLRAIEKSLIVRDGLEDQYASSGVIAEPIVVDGFTMDVKFTFGNITAAGRLRSALIVSSAMISIGLPPGVKIEELTFPNEGSNTGESSP